MSHVATLIANPARAGLTPEIAAGAQRVLDGHDFCWLSEGIAAEFSLPALPSNHRELWEELQSRGIDFTVQPADGRRKRLLIADMDSTMIGQECIDELAALAGVGAQVAAITTRTMNGELEFDAALRERVALLEGLPEGTIAEVIATRLTYTPGGGTLVATMQAAGGHAALVSGGFTAFTEAVAGHLGFDEHRANRLEIANGRLTGKVAAPILGRQAKVDALHEISARLGLAPGDAIAVGDGANDLGMLRAAGSGVALHAKPAVAAQCDLRINHGDLTALLYLQGYSESDFA